MPSTSFAIPKEVLRSYFLADEPSRHATILTTADYKRLSRPHPNHNLDPTFSSKKIWLFGAVTMILLPPARRMTISETNSRAMTGAYHSPSPAFPSSATSGTLSPAYSSRHDDASDQDALSDFDPLPCNPKLGFPYDGASCYSKVPFASAGGVDASIPLYSSDLGEIFTEYEKAFQALANDKQHVIAGTDTCKSIGRVFAFLAADSKVANDTTSNSSRSEARCHTVSSVRTNSPSAPHPLPKRAKPAKRMAG